MTRTVTIATAIICTSTAAWVAWAALRPAPAAPQAGIPALPELRIDTVRAVLDDPAFGALVTLVPPLAPAVVGNPNPFAIPRPQPPARP